MKMKIIVAAAALAVALCGCRLAAAAESENKTGFRMMLVDAYGEMCIYQDANTGVQYFYSRQGGICPLFNADGSLYVGG